MIIDSSALVAVLRREPEAAALVRAMLRDATRLMSAANLLEAGIVVDHQMGLSAARPAGVRRFRQRQPSGWAELRRLLRVCARQGEWRAAAVQGR
jgi:uncharacterized protein with PIN domain